MSEAAPSSWRMRSGGFANIVTLVVMITAISTLVGSASAHLSQNYYSKTCPKLFPSVYSVLGGPNWKVKLGRRDAKTASLSAANSGVIPPPTSTLNNLITRFQARGLSTKDMVVLSDNNKLTSLVLKSL
ncbi:hypothetical protein SAY87_013958 [Trapa incisa]|uniref:peroxidase n=1 Tax=Trapa incisa TaxID=236973 RepID=A0AAN7KC46_9MYRT|nr:hypothetical protein SAY87_013958 [Trapa incisa]